jgi:uncharacterized NAD(P)/FAD-binding protein YdhS
MEKTLKKIIITAAPVGAVPRHVNPSEPKFIPAVVIESLMTAAERQLSLDSTKHWIDSLWTDFDVLQKRRFLRKYQGFWMSYRHPMPMENARKLLELLKTRRLMLHRGYRSTTLVRGGGHHGFQVHLASGRLSVDRIIDATGHAGNLARLDCPLLDSLIDEGFVRQHPAGGLSIDTATHELTGQRGIYALGPLTQGALFYVSAIERLAVHADAIAGHLLEAASPIAKMTPSVEVLAQPSKLR